MSWLFKLITGIILLFAGLGFACSGAASAAVFGAMPFALEELVAGTSGGAAVPAIFGAGFSLIFVVVGIALLAGGGLLTYLGIKDRRKLAAQAEQLQEFGVEADGTITFIDRNFRMLVNNRPIYSIVEYTFEDNFGHQHTGRVDNFPSDTAIRLKLEVGSRVRVKYLKENPAQSMLLSANPDGDS